MGFKINRVKVDLRSYPPYMFLAPRKFGKTSWFYNLVNYLYNDMTKGLLISFAGEEGYHSLDGLQVEVAKDWTAEYDEETDLRGFVEIVDDIVENNDQYGIELVALDTLDTLVDVAIKEVLRQHRKEKGTICKTLNEAFSGYGRGKARLLKICNEQIDRLRDAGIAVFYLCHIKNKEKKDLLSGETYEMITNNLTDDIYSNFADSAQMVMVGAFDREINGGKIISEKRTVYLRGNATVEAGSRFDELPETITLDPKDFMDAFENAVKASMKSSKSDDKTIAKMKKEEAEERKKLSEIAKKKDIETRNNNEEDIQECIKTIAERFPDASDDVKKTAKEVLTNAGFKKFTEDGVPVSVLQEIVALLK